MHFLTDQLFFIRVTEHLDASFIDEGTIIIEIDPIDPLSCRIEKYS